ncbi:MAG: hypothetical protein ACR2PK_15970 [Acidimicrobiales bacterium]
MAEKPPARERAQSIEAAAIAGMVYAMSAAASITILSAPPSLSGPDEAVIDWYVDESNQNLLFASLTLATVAAIAFLWFLGVIRRRLGATMDTFVSTVFLASGVIVAALTLVGVSAHAAVGESIDLRGPNDPDVGAVASATGFSRTILFFALPRIQSVFVLTTSTLMLRTGRFRPGLTYFGYFVAVLMFLIPVVMEPLGLLFPVWVTVLSLALFARRAEIRRDMA